MCIQSATSRHSICSLDEKVPHCWTLRNTGSLVVLMRGGQHRKAILLVVLLVQATLVPQAAFWKLVTVPSVQHSGDDGRGQNSSHHNRNTYDSVETELRNLSIRYFVYEDDRYLVQPGLTKWFRNGKGNPTLRARFGADAHQEDRILNTLSQHHLRITNKSLASLFIVPLRVGAAIIAEKLDIFPMLPVALMTNTTFLTQPHVMVSFTNVGFNKIHIRKLMKTHGITRKFYENIAPLIVAQSYAAHAAANVSLQGGSIGHDYETMFWDLNRAMSHHGFSVGLLPQDGLPFHEATYAKFRNAKNMFFYQTRVEPSAHNSTRFRQIILEPSVLNRLLATTNSSIGYGLPPDDWLREFSSSQFCLAIRGDTPHTHALLNSVKVGCIPVVISDFYPLFSPSFPSTLNMKDFCVFIPEADFIRDPAMELLKLKELGETLIRRKLDALAFAQKVVLMDHPESLFVPAFVKESMYAYQHKPPAELSIAYKNHVPLP